MKNDNKEINQGGMGYLSNRTINELTGNEKIIMIDPQEEYKKIAEMLSLKDNQLEIEGFYDGISKIKEGCKFEKYEKLKNASHFIVGTPGVEEFKY